jgi:hypothetical protein
MAVKEKLIRLFRGKYATKDSNVKKLKVYLNKIENGS